MPDFTLVKQKPKILEFPSGRLLTETDLPKPQTTLAFSPQIKQQLDGAVSKGYPVEKINKGIDLHPEIQDKKSAKDYVVSALGKIGEGVKAIGKHPATVLREALPFMPKTLELEMKKRTFEFYPFTEEAKSLVANTRVKDFFSEDKGSIEGEYQPRGYTKNMLGLPSKEKIKLYKPEIPTVAHELLHDIFQRTVAWEHEGFNSEWEKEKENDPILQNIDRYLFGSQTYEGIVNNPFSLATERFAYLGMDVGMRGLGLKKLPENIKKYYEGVFKFNGTK